MIREGLRTDLLDASYIYAEYGSAYWDTTGIHSLRGGIMDKYGEDV